LDFLHKISWIVSENTICNFPKKMYFLNKGWDGQVDAEGGTACPRI
jgi:hypothetical protein